MTKPTRIHTSAEIDAKEILQEAIDQNFRFVVIVGVNDSGVHFKKSKDNDMLRVLGALEHAKQQAMELWK